MNLLVIEDDRKLNRMLCEILEKEGYTVKACTDGEEGAYYLQQNAYDLALVDWMLPGESGPDILRESRRKGIMTPVVMLTALTAVENKVTCLDAGADDYLAKPFSFTELSARVKALLRRYCVYLGKEQAPQKPRNTTLEAHGVRLALDCNRVWVDEREVDLTETEYKILRLLMQNPQRIYSIQVIYETVWNEPYYYVSNGTVMVHIRNLRMKVEDDPQNPARICTVWGKGYRFAAGEEGRL